MRTELLRFNGAVDNTGRSPSIGVATNVQFVREASRTKACGWSFSCEDSL
jgi:hypothetical protein